MWSCNKKKQERARKEREKKEQETTKRAQIEREQIEKEQIERERIEELQKVATKKRAEEQVRNAKQTKDRWKNRLSVKPPVQTTESSTTLLPFSQYLGIRYRLVKTEQFDNYMKALGVNMVLRRVGYKVVPTLFQLDHNDIPIQVTAPDGRQCQVTYSFRQPNILVEVQSGIRPIVGTREFSVEKIHMTLTVHKTSCKLTYVNEAKQSAHRKTIHVTSPTATISSEENK